MSPTFVDPDFGIPGTFSVLDTEVGDADRVVFAANWNTLTTGFYVWNNGVITKVPGTDGLLGTPAINDNGVVAGLVTGGGPTRLSIFEGGTENTVISVGDPLYGSTVTGLNFSAEGFNNLNQLAFQATLADGRTVNVLSALPEPGGAAMLLLAGSGLLARRRRARAA